MLLFLRLLRHYWGWGDVTFVFTREMFVLSSSHSVQESHLGSADLVVVHRGRKVGKHSDASKTAGNREKKKKTKKVKKRSSLSPRRPKGRASIEKQCESRHLTRSLSPEPTVELPETPEGGDEALSATHSHPLGVEPQPQWGRGVTASMLDPIVMDATSPGDECATSSRLCLNICILFFGGR